MIPTIEELKECIFNKQKYFLCRTNFCGNKDGYCPHYDCGCLDKLKTYTDKQWKNAMRYVMANTKNNAYFLESFAVEVIDYLWTKQGRN